MREFGRLIATTSHTAVRRAIPAVALLRCEGCRLLGGGLRIARSAELKGERNSRVQTERASCSSPQATARSGSGCEGSIKRKLNRYLERKARKSHSGLPTANRLGLFLIDSLNVWIF